MIPSNNSIGAVQNFGSFPKIYTQKNWTHLSGMYGMYILYIDTSKVNSSIVDK